MFAICVFCVMYRETGARDIRRLGDATIRSLPPPSTTAKAPIEMMTAAVAVAAVEANSSDGGPNSILDCISCLSKQPQLNEMIRVQKIAHRLEYIKQQLKSNLHVETPLADPPKLENLPGFLVDQLVNSPAERKVEDVREEDAKQMVLFPDRGKILSYSL